MSEIKTNKISPRKGTTTTIGDSGDTISLPSGTSLNIQGTYSGINSISWDTTAKTANFTAETNKGYFINTTSGSVTITLPATPVAGSFIGIKDYALTAQTNAIEINPNGNKIQGVTSNFKIDTQGGAANLVYVDATQGWLTYDAAQASDIAETPIFITATGGTITTCGNDKIHTFTGPGTFTVTQIGNAPTVPTGGPQNVDYLVVAGGGGAGHAGGAGAGGHRTSYPTCGGALPVSVTSYPITVGGGGTGHVFNTVNATSGSDSIFSTITSAGGGNGAQAAVVTAGNGGSGGGGSGTSYGAAPYPTGGSGNTPPASPSQGNNGGDAGSTGGGAGGGIGAVGANGSGGTGGAGGSGSANSINGTSVTRAGGGGGGGDSAGAGGSGGGGAGGSGDSNGTSGTTNTGGGGGGIRISSGIPGTTAGSGGSGIVIIRYKYQ
jgi:hypothetical protein